MNLLVFARTFHSSPIPQFIKEAANLWPQQQEKMCQFLRSLFVCKKMNLCFSIHSLQQLVFQDEKGFSLQVPTNHQNFNGLFQWSRERCETGMLEHRRKQIFQKRLCYLLWQPRKELVSLSLLVAMESNWMEPPSWSISVMTWSLLLKQCIRTKISHLCKIVLRSITPIKCKTSWSRSWSPDLLRTLIGLQNRLIATL